MSTESIVIEGCTVASQIGRTVRVSLSFHVVGLSTASEPAKGGATGFRGCTREGSRRNIDIDARGMDRIDRGLLRAPDSVKCPVWHPVAQ